MGGHGGYFHIMLSYFEGLSLNDQSIESLLSPASDVWRRQGGETASFEFPISPATASLSLPAVQAPPC